MTSQELAELARVRRQCKSGAAKAIRLSAGVSIVEVSSVTGAALSTVWRWENGQRAPHGAVGLAYSRLIDELAGVRA